MRVSHAAGPCSIPGWHKFTIWGFFFRGFYLPVRQMSGNFRSTSMNGCVNDVYCLSCSCCLGCGPGTELIPDRGGHPCPCVVKKVCMWSKVVPSPDRSWTLQGPSGVNHVSAPIRGRINYGNGWMELVHNCSCTLLTEVHYRPYISPPLVPISSKDHPVPRIKTHLL